MHGGYREGDVEIDCDGGNGMEDLVGSEAAAGRVMQVHVGERGRAAGVGPAYQRRRWAVRTIGVCIGQR